MASFYGTIDEFDRFLMPRIRNRVQFLARPLKERAGGVCEHCGERRGTLEAAHVHGRDRKTIVREALEKYRVGDGFHIGDLDAFEAEVVEAHEPLGETFLFLCRDCHRAYDAEPAHAGNRAQTPPPAADVAVAGRRRPPLKGADDDLAEEYHDYLANHEGKTVTTSGGNPGTCYSYKRAVAKVCEWEGCGWSDLPDLIDVLIEDYSPGGVNEARGRQSNNTVVNALRAFGRFARKRDALADA